MIHDIEPKHLYNEWKPNAVPKRSSAVVQFCGRNLLCRIDDNGLKLPSRAMFPDGDERFTYLFELDGREYYLLRDETPRGPDGWTYRDIGIFRTEQPKEIAFAAVSALCAVCALAVGYLRTADALRRAERNAALAGAALSGVFRSVENQSPSRRDTQLLSELLPYYGELARRQDMPPDKIAEANRILGTCAFRTGNYALAERAFRHLTTARTTAADRNNQIGRAHV